MLELITHDTSELLSSFNINPTRAHNLTQDITRGFDLSKAYALDLIRALNLADTAMQLYKQWGLEQQQQNTPSLDFKNWMLTSPQFDKLWAYLNGIHRLLECLGVATIENRHAVLDRLLKPLEADTAG